MKIYFEIRGRQVEDAEPVLLFKFSVHNFKNEEEARNYCEEFAADLKSKDVTDIEIIRVEE